MFSLSPPPKRKNKGAQGSMFITLIMVMVSWVYACTLTHQIIYVNICAVFVYQLDFSKSEEKEKKESKGGRRREREGRKEGRNKEGGRKGKRKNVRRKGRRQLCGRGAGFLLSGLMIRAAFLIQSPSGVLIFIYLHAAFVLCFFPLKESISVTQKGRKFEIHCFLLVRKIKLCTQLVSGAQDNWEFFSCNFFFDST